MTSSERLLPNASIARAPRYVELFPRLAISPAALLMM
jgi:hypothetical protein